MQPLSRESLARDAVVTSVIGRLLYHGPSDDLLDHLAASRLLSRLGLDHVSAGAAMAADLLGAWEERCANGVPPDESRSIHDDHVRLFVGPGRLGAPPWESIYGDGDRDQVLWTMSTLDVRRWYLRHGFERASSYHEPEDHLGLQLEFVSRLARRAADEVGRGDRRAAEVTADALRLFLLEHVVRWVPKWCAVVLRNARTDFYRGVALSAASVVVDLDARYDVLGELRTAKGRDAGQLETPSRLLSLAIEKGQTR